MAQRGEKLEILLDAVFDKIDHDASQNPVELGQTLYATFLNNAGLEGRALDPANEERSFDEMAEDSLIERWRERGLGRG